MPDVVSPLPSPGVGSRRKGPKSLPKLPLSAFSQPNTGTSDRFPLPPSPSAVHPERVVDAHVQLDVADVDAYRKDVEEAFGSKLDGVVLSLSISDAETMQEAVQKISAEVPVLAATIPFPLEDGAPSSVPSFLSSGKPQICLSTTVSKNSKSHSEGIAWALKQGCIVDVHADTGESETAWEILEDVVGKALESSEPLPGKVLFSNLLPPPHSFSTPLVKLLTDPTYLSYQSHIASLSLLPNVYIKYLPPAWGEVPEASLNNPSNDAKEWKRRVKMYLGHVVEAFGYGRIVFGSSSSAAGNTPKPGYWYEIARESLAELGLEQADIDAVFATNARQVYGV